MKKSLYSQWEAFRVSPEIKKMLAEIAAFMRRDKSETFRTIIEKTHKELINANTQN